MSYTVFARKYRPQSFDEVVGQDPVVTTLKNALKQGRVAHAYLFTGPRGVGKTSLTRILAKALNCQKGPTDKPCNKCDICRSISEGSDMDVLEIDGASNRGIDEVRTIRGNVKYLPSRSRFKIYIIDEVHMLTREAFNALLKTLEEPPSHVKFFFATTAPGKLPETVQSRCQRFDLKNVTPSDIVKRLSQIAKQEEMDIAEEALKAIARHSRGGLRDAQSLLDQLGSFSEGGITLEDVQGLLGTVSEEKVETLVDSLMNKDAAGALKVVHGVISEGRDTGVFVDQLVWYLRDLLVVATCGFNAELLENPWREKQLLERQAKDFGPDTLMYMIQVLTEMKRKAVDDLQERIFLEMAMVRLAGIEDLEPLDSILHRLEELEKNVSRGAASSVTPSTGKHKDTGIKTGMKQAETARAEVDPAKTGKATAKSVSSQDVNEVWERVMNHFHKARPLLWSRLKNGRLSSLGSKDAVIAFPKGRPFVKSSVEKDTEGLKQIEDCLKDVTGKRLRLSVVLSDDVPVVAEASGPAANMSDDGPHAESPEKSKVGKVVSFFEGEILK
ncbi:MAG: DNA polymerase III subunit gamma/tau [Candidatus Brocadiales bacterium]|nr:DNA polymerase III subunit gamma/tau [Candidatus Bathyanammoxibius amoris]